MAMATDASAQLDKWLLRSGSGEVRTVDFAGGDPLLGNLIPSFGLGGYEDVNLMTDANGNILFASAVEADNKIQVRTASFDPMPNGNGLFSSVSSHSSAIVPRPCHPTQYYIIHHDGVAHNHFYSVVDMALNGGQGAVVEKNIFLAPDMGEGMAVSRKMENGCRWLFGFGVDEDKILIKRALITATGIDAPQEIASINVPNGTAWFSTLKLSPNGDQLAISLPNDLQPSAADVATWSVDMETGALGSTQFLALSNDPIVGIEFSPGGNYLYYAGNSALPGMELGRMELSTQETEVLDPDIGPWVLSIECAGNGRLYVGTAGFPRTLAEVRFPDDANDPGYDRDALVFWTLGFLPALPNAIEGEEPGDTTTPPFVDFHVEELPDCQGHLFTSEACLATWQQWDFGDGWTDLSDRPIHHYGVGTFDVTLTVQSCGQFYSIVHPAMVTVEGTQPEAAFTVVDSVCQFAATAFTNESQLASSYRWWFGDGGTSTAEEPIHAFVQHGERTVTLVATEGCIHDTARVAVQVLPAALASFETSSDPCDEYLRLVNTSYGGDDDWFWAFGDGDTATYRDPIHTYQSMEAFDVMLISDRGTMCADTARMTLHAGYGLIPVAWFVPNAFTPNGDGINDVLQIKGPEVCASPVMTVHNKWGEAIWEGDCHVGWDGTYGGQPAPEGVYVYAMKGRLDDMKHGWFVLIR